MQFKTTNKKYEYLRKKWIAKQAHSSQKLIEKHGSLIRHLTIGGLGGLVMLTTPGLSAAMPDQQIYDSAQKITSLEDKNIALAKTLQGIIPDQVGSLNKVQEDNIAKTLSEEFDMPVSAEINGIRLNRSYGLIGGEQHLYRYPGDTVFNQMDTTVDWAMYGSAGMAPGLGAWGYFAPSKAQLTAEDIAREKYYIAVQTFLAPSFAENVANYRDFFKYRKMLVVNPQTGQAVVADIADAGPAEWTGKQLGGSPEVMQALGLGSGSRKGAVLYFFIDDPNDQIPLGPINAKGIES
ncbi:hypothetical protein M1563_04595 [Patescibacteria group bacterium]|nr:hypothetical protein [Patescibacteria group bacterium]MCL5409732.1 hypothetical protein [Patescibacteria group bacterium]